MSKRWLWDEAKGGAAKLQKVKTISKQQNTNIRMSMIVSIRMSMSMSMIIITSVSMPWEAASVQKRQEALGVPPPRGAEVLAGAPTLRDILRIRKIRINGSNTPTYGQLPRKSDLKDPSS